MSTSPGARRSGDERLIRKMAILTSFVNMTYLDILTSAQATSSQESQDGDDGSGAAKLPYETDDDP
jgi:hypothetical protein